jgi:hypothetical protein
MFCYASVSRSAFYGWASKRRVTPKEVAYAALVKQVREAHARSRHTDVGPRIQAVAPFGSPPAFQEPSNTDPRQIARKKSQPARSALGAKDATEAVGRRPRSVEHLA